MLKFNVLNQLGKEVSEIELSADVFGITPNEKVLHDAVVMQRASLRQGTHKAKTRTEVRGGGKKPWRQKGTGRARQGSIRAPHWRGGGIAFGPTPRDYSYKLNKKVRRLALKSALSLKVAAADMVVVDKIEFATPKTKDFAAMLTALNVDRKVMVVTSEYNEVVAKSAANLPNVIYRTANGVNVLEIMNSTKLVVTADAVEAIEGVLK